MTRPSLPLRLYDGLLDGLALLAAALLFAVTIGIGFDVIARYFFNRPIGWMSEFVQHSMLLILFLGIGWLTRERGHVAVEILLDVVSKPVRRAIEVAAMLLSAAISGFVGVWAAIATWDSATRGVVTEGIYPIQRYWLLGVTALGLLLTTMEFLRSAVTMLANPEAEVRQVDAELEAVVSPSKLQD
jgi:TRAP-type C4-dicarboxylate transport system permease small subunit